MDPLILMVLGIALMLLLAVLTVHYGKMSKVKLHKTRHADLTRMLHQQNWPLVRSLYEIQTITGELLKETHFFRNHQLNFAVKDTGGNLYPCTNYSAYPFYVNSLLLQRFVLGTKPLYGEFVLVQISTDEGPEYPQNPYALLSFKPLGDISAKRAKD